MLDIASVRKATAVNPDSKQDTVRSIFILLTRYLFPLNEDKAEKERIKGELLDLRNRVCLAFLLINALFIILLFTLQTISETTPNLKVTLPLHTSGERRCGRSYS